MKLLIDKQSIHLNAFVQKALWNIFQGILESLDNVPENHNRIRCVIEDASKLSLTVDQTDILLNDFAKRITVHVILGMISSLDGIPDDFREITLVI